MSEENTNLVKLASWAEEKIGLENYSNVTVGGSIARYVEDGDNSHIANKLRENFALVEMIVAEQRELVLADVQSSKKNKNDGY